MTRIANFSKYYKVDPLTGCWEWQLTKLRGYGRMTYKKKVQSSHRWFYEQMVRKIPQGLTIDHLCKNKGCVNPKHLEPVSITENIRRNSKLDVNKIARIKTIYLNTKITQTELGIMFGIGQSMVSYILSGGRWL